MATYPEWIMKYKEKGTYVNFAKGKYYLYAAHSEISLSFQLYFATLHIRTDRHHRCSDTACQQPRPLDTRLEIYRTSHP